MLAVRCKSKVKIFAKVLGGVWKYDGICMWWCDDGKRSVARYSAGVDEWDNELGPPQYWLYGDGIPKRIWWKYDGGLELM
jgi:hypothetical protein